MDIGLPDIQQVIETLDPLPGSVEFVEWFAASFSGRYFVRYVLRICHAADEKTGVSHSVLPSSGNG